MGRTLNHKFFLYHGHSGPWYCCSCDKNWPWDENDLPPQVFISQVWDLLFTKNFCTSDPKPPNPNICPIIIKPMAPAGIDPKNSREAVDYYPKNPQWVLYYILTILNTLLMCNSGISDGEVILPQYLWMLRILTVNLSIIYKSAHWSKAEQWVEHLLCYVVATCYPKLLCHISNQVSQSYIQSSFLLQQTTTPFPEPKDHYTPTPMKHVGDCHLAHFILSCTLPIHEYPDIVAQASSVINRINIPLYTGSTCQQFHNLLCWLLSLFQDHLQMLRSRNGKKPSGKMHLENIEHLLNDHCCSESNSMPKVKREEDPWEDVELEQDVEIKAVHFSTTMNGMQIPLWMSYHDQLRLMIVYFYAMNILVSYVSQPNFNHNISIKILVAPPVDNALLP